MRAVNLIPAEVRRGAGGAAGRSGGAVYVLLGALALLVALSVAYATAGRTVTDRQAELADVRRQADSAQAQAAALEPYSRFASLRDKRFATVSSLAANRFDFAHAMREVARVVPSNAWLTAMVGTVTPNVRLETAGTQTSALRGASQVPALEVAGCTTSQASVARMLVRMRLIDGVERVALAASEKGDSSAGGGSDCRQGSSRYPKFELVVFFRAATAAAPAATGGKQPTAQPTPTTTPDSK